MKHVKVLNINALKGIMKESGCGECRTSCQSAYETSCIIGNQSYENINR